jgi:hypothetical protein
MPAVATGSALRHVPPVCLPLPLLVLLTSGQAEANDAVVEAQVARVVAGRTQVLAGVEIAAALD